MKLARAGLSTGPGEVQCRFGTSRKLGVSPSTGVPARDRRRGLESFALVPCLRYLAKVSPSGPVFSPKRRARPEP